MKLYVYSIINQSSCIWWHFIVWLILRGYGTKSEVALFHSLPTPSPSGLQWGDLRSAHCHLPPHLLLLSSSLLGSLATIKVTSLTRLTDPHGDMISLTSKWKKEKKTPNLQNLTGNIYFNLFYSNKGSRWEYVLKSCSIIYSVMHYKIQQLHHMLAIYLSILYLYRNITYVYWNYVCHYFSLDNDKVDEGEKIQMRPKGIQQRKNREKRKRRKAKTAS